MLTTIVSLYLTSLELLDTNSYLLRQDCEITVSKKTLNYDYETTIYTFLLTILTDFVVIVRCKLKIGSYIVKFRGQKYFLTNLM